LVGSTSMVEVFPDGVTITIVSGLIVTLVVWPWTVVTEVIVGVDGSKVMTVVWPPGVVTVSGVEGTIVTSVV